MLLRAYQPVYCTGRCKALRNMKPNDVEHIDELRIELHKMVEQNELTCDAVQKLSRELDKLILKYYDDEEFNLKKR